MKSKESSKKEYKSKEKYFKEDSFNRDTFISTDSKSNIQITTPSFNICNEDIFSPYNFSPSFEGFNNSEFESAKKIYQEEMKKKFYL